MRIARSMCAILAATAVLTGTLIGSPVARAQSDEPGPLYGPTALYGSIAPVAGWGFGPSNITDPGPPITVNAGEAVHLDLFSRDGAPHSWLLDLDGSGGPDAGEPLSSTFTSGSIPTAFMFVNPMTPGTYKYICGIHGLAMWGFWTIRATNQAPTVTLTNPDGAATNRWTGGSSHSISWSAADPDGLPAQLVIYLNYSWNAGANRGTIAGPLANIPPFDWTVPLIDAGDVHVLAEAIDPGGAKGSDDNTVPIVDSTRPTVTATVPADLATGVPTNTALDITFSETMNQLSAQNAVSLCR
ncbi:MAG TPA: Ig-like domain-containing protein, partial [Thermoplasmata archaeon]|nr:Ig-like domain-containing protein [Thermoplasmata archaeon]